MSDEQGFVHKAGKWVDDNIIERVPFIKDALDNFGITALFKGATGAADDGIGALTSTAKVVTGNGSEEDLKKILGGGLPAIIGFLASFWITNGSIVKSMLFAGIAATGWKVLTNHFNKSANPTEPKPELPKEADIKNDSRVVANSSTASVKIPPGFFGPTPEPAGTR